MRWVCRYVAVACLASGLGLSQAPGCRRAQAASDGRLRVVCTTGMVADLARNIAGRRADVVNLMGEGVDPHLYTVTPGDLRKLSGADLILYNGLMLEGKMDPVFKRLATRKPTVAVAEYIDKSRLRTWSHGHEGYDPHIWFDVSLWIEAGRRTRDALIEVDPGGADEYRANAEAYLGQLAELHEECKRLIAAVPRQSRVLVTAHDAFGYFGQAYDVDVRGLQGMSTESEASLKDLNELSDMIVAQDIKAVFVESSVPPKNIEALVANCQARGRSLKLGGELFSDAMGAKGTPEGTYIGMVRHNVRTIVEALK